MERYVYSVRDYFNMLRLYFVHDQQENRAAAAYQQEYQGHGQPNRNVVANMVDRLLNHGQLMPIYGGGRPRTARTVENTEDILVYFQMDGTASVREAERELGIPKSTIHRVLKEEKLHAYHYRRVQCLHENDPANRYNFCEDFIRRAEADQTFSRRILWTDESSFTREGMFNSHNYHYWCDENPHLTREKSFQERWTINVWAGLLGDQLVHMIFCNNHERFKFLIQSFTILKSVHFILLLYIRNLY